MNETLRIAYGTENISLNRGAEHMILTKEDLAFIVESAIRNGEVVIKVSSNSPQEQK